MTVTTARPTAGRSHDATLAMTELATTVGRSLPVARGWMPPTGSSSPTCGCTPTWLRPACRPVTWRWATGSCRVRHHRQELADGRLGEPTAANRRIVTGSTSPRRPRTTGPGPSVTRPGFASCRALVVYTCCGPHVDAHCPGCYTATGSAARSLRPSQWRRLANPTTSTRTLSSVGLERRQISEPCTVGDSSSLSLTSLASTS